PDPPTETRGRSFRPRLFAYFDEPWDAAAVLDVELCRGAVQILLDERVLIGRAGSFIAASGATDHIECCDLTGIVPEHGAPVGVFRGLFFFGWLPLLLLSLFLLLFLWFLLRGHLLSARLRLLRAQRRKRGGEKETEQERQLPVFWAHENLLAATEVLHYRAGEYAKPRVTWPVLDLIRQDKQAGEESSTMLSRWRVLQTRHSLIVTLLNPRSNSLAVTLIRMLMAGQASAAAPAMAACRKIRRSIREEHNVEPNPLHKPTCSSRSPETEVMSARPWSAEVLDWSDDVC